MSDGIKAWAEDEEEKRQKQYMELFSKMRPEETLIMMDEIYMQLGPLLRDDTLSVRTYHRIKAIRDAADKFMEKARSK